MNAGDLGSYICTPYLVNMILADACLLDTLTEEEDGPNAWLRDQFYNEAERGLEAEKAQVSFAVLATQGVQWTNLNTNGQDKLGNPVLYKQIYLAKDLEKWRSRIEQSPNMTEQILRSIDKNMDRLSWTLFALSSLTLINLEKPLPLSPPKRPKPAREHDKPEGQHTWQPYPQPSQAFVFHAGCHYHAFLSLAEMIMRNETLFIAEDRTEADMERFHEIYQQLEQWPQNLSDCMELSPRATPHVLSLHALHQWIMVILSKQIAASDAGHSDRPMIVHTPQSSEHAHWRDVCIGSSIQISRIFARHRIDWGNHHFPVIIMQPVSIALFALLEDLAVRPESQEALVELCITVYAASRRFKVGKGTLGAIRNVAEREDVQLPEHCRQLIAAMTRATSRSNLNSEGQLPSLGVDWLLEKWDDLDLDQD